MKTLKSIPIPDNRHNMLAWAENEAYSVKILYFMNDDFTAQNIKDISKDDLILDITPKKDKYPNLTILLEDEKDGIEQNFSVDIQERDIIELKSIDSYIEVMKVAGDTLADIKEMLMNMVPQFVH